LEIISNFIHDLEIRLISEPDQGIYDAMNKGLRSVKTPLVHYLNSGDLAAGDLYLNCNKPALLPVKIYDPASGVSWLDSVKLSGYGYCHQGIVFPSDHSPFDVSLTIAADFDVVCKTFPDGLRVLPMHRNGHVVYELGGVSSVKSDLGNRQIISVASNLLNRNRYYYIRTYIGFKKCLPRFLRRFLANLFMRKGR
jgi:hypothetical protein